MSTLNRRRRFIDPPMSVATESSAVNRTGTWRFARPVFVRRVGPCTEACPAEEKIDEVMLLASQGRFADAYRLIRQDNPLPGVCGRVCLHFCEGACHRRSFDEAVSIRSVERAIADQAMEQGIAPDLPSHAMGGEIAVVGSGPAGLSAAYFLRMRGHKVTIFEAQASAGGMLRQAIPEYRLPKRVLDWEIDQVLSPGVDFRGGTRVGRDVTMEELRSFRAVFVAPGAGLDSSVPGVDSSIEGVYGALAFLRGRESLGGSRLSGRVAIIGGGNTAIDAARVALRRGGEPVVLYRRSRREMPAAEEEITQAEREGVVFRYLVGVTGIVRGPRGGVKALLCVRTSLGQEDESGRSSFQVVESSQFELEVDHVVVAAGQRADLSFLPSLRRREDGLIDVTGDVAASLPGVFAGGDAVFQPRTVAHAIASGKRAALSIDLLLRGESDGSLNSKTEVVPYEGLRTDCFSHSRRLSPVVLPSRQARESFDEVEKGLSRRQAVQSAGRCFNCGICSFCERCDAYCPDIAIRLDTPLAQRSIDYDHCKGCGICVAECPRGAIGWEKEK